MLASRVLRYGVYGGTSGLLLLGSIKLYDPTLQISPVGIVRFGRAALTASSIAADYKWTLYNAEKTSHDYDEILSKIHLRSAQKLKAVFCKNGGAFIKVGQHIGGLDYLLPDEYVKTMKQLHNNAPESNIADLFKTIEVDLNCKVHEIFKSIEDRPIGTASLAQCHKAYLHDGTCVAVKIQHPDVKKNSSADIKTMTFLIHCLGKIFPDFKFKWLAEETAKNLPVELDFVNEADNVEKVANMFKNHSFIKVPKIYRKYCSDRIITMEYCEGFTINDRANIMKNNINVNKITERLGIIFSEMIFANGFVHCDPHPGNVLIRPITKTTETNHQNSDSKKTNDFEIVLLDHGLYQELSEDFRYNYAKIWMAILDKDINRLEVLTQKWNIGEYFGLFACIVTGRSWDAINNGIKDVKFSENEAATIQKEASLYLREISIVLNLVPREMLLLFKTNDLLRGIETNLETRTSSSSFLHMTKCCIKLTNSYERSQRPIQRLSKASELPAFAKQLEFFLFSVLRERMCLLKIFAYELFLYLNIL